MSIHALESSWLEKEVKNMEPTKMMKIRDMIQIDEKGKEAIIRGVPTSSRKNGNGLEAKIISIKDIKNGVITLDPEQKRIVKNQTVIDKSKLEEGDVLVATRGSTFKAAVVASKAIEYIPSQNLIGLRLNHNVLPEFMVAYLNGRYGQHALNEIGKGATISSISIKDLEELLIPVPSMEVQKIIAETVLSIQEYRDLVKQEQDIIEMINDSIGSSIFGEI